MSLNLSLFCCQNDKCTLYGIRNGGNITITAKYGKYNDKFMLRCKTCKSRFSQNKGTVYYRSHKSKEKVDSILSHIREGVGIRKTSRLENVYKDTVTKFARKAGEHAYNLHNELVSFSPLYKESTIR